MTTAESMKLEPMVPKGQGDVREFPWGRIVWTVAGHLGNSDTLTFGIVTINPYGGERREKMSLFTINSRLCKRVGICVEECPPRIIDDRAPARRERIGDATYQRHNPTPR